MDVRRFTRTMADEGMSPAVTDAIVEFVEGAREELVTNQTLQLEMEKLGGELRREMAGLKGELRQEMASLKGELRQEVASLKGELRQEMAELKGDIRQEMAELRGELRTDFANHRAEMYRLVLGTSGLIGLLVLLTRLF